MFFLPAWTAQDKTTFSFVNYCGWYQSIQFTWVGWINRRRNPPSVADLGLSVPPPDQQTPEALGALQAAEIKKWWPIIKTAGIKAQWSS
jgi:hypothetical protein